MSSPKVLMVAAHVPPYSGGSGYLRTTKFCKYLPEFGWEPLVLAPSNSAFAPEDINLATEQQLACPVTRTFALDSARHLSIRGRYPDILAVPDRWVSWCFSAVTAGLRLVRKQRPRAIFSTYPIATTHLIGLVLARLSGLPWVADFRDPMIEERYPPPGMARRARASIERRALQRCAAALFTTPGTLEDYRERFPGESAEKFHLIMNGFDESDFPDPADRVDVPELGSSALQLVHSGALDPDFRDPGALFQALAELSEAGEISSDTLRVRLRASGQDDIYRPLISSLGIENMVSLEPREPYRNVLAEMRTVDGLLLFQGADANKQVPAKLFEYLGAGKPILALLDSEGDTSKVLREERVGRIAQIDDVCAIKDAIREFVANASARRAWAAPATVAERYSRRAGAAKLAGVLDVVGNTTARVR